MMAEHVQTRSRQCTTLLIVLISLGFWGATPLDGIANERQFAVIDNAARSARFLSRPANGRELGRIPAGTRLEILEKRNVKTGMLTQTWYRISYESVEGWVSQYVTVGKHPSPLR